MKKNIKIQTYPEFLSKRSDPQKSFFFFSYQVKIINNSEKTVRLLSRYWHIEDGKGQFEDIHGRGVVGQTPWIRGKDFFQYTSFCPLPTPIGFMSGSYRMILENGEQFDAEIPQFRLIAPDYLN